MTFFLKIPPKYIGRFILALVFESLSLLIENIIFLMKLPFQLIQVFDDPKLGFIGNTSTVVFLQNQLTVGQMQRIAADQLQPATTFLWPAQNEGEYNVRWFAPDEEIGLCGHGSMASIAFLKNILNRSGTTTLHYKTGSLVVECIGDAQGKTVFAQIPVLNEVEVPEAIAKGLNIPILNMYATTNKHMILTDSEANLQSMQPDFNKLRESEIFGYAVTAKGDKVDFVSRTLVPHVHQLEDPATGSSHAALFPFWGEKLNKTNMVAHQLSARGGKFSGELLGSKVSLTGNFRVLAHGNIDMQGYL